MSSAKTTYTLDRAGLDRIDAALRRRLADPDADVRASVAAAWAALERHAPDRPLAALLDGADAPRRVAILDALGTRGHTALPAVALGQSGHSEPAVRAAALRAAARLAACCGDDGDHGAVGSAVEAALARDPEPVVREAAARALEGLASPNREDALLSALGDPAVREAALATLDAIGWLPASDTGLAVMLMARRDFSGLAALGEVAVPLLLGTLRDQDRDKDSVRLRARAIEALAVIGTDGAIAAIERGLDDVGSIARAAATRALCGAGGRVSATAKARLSGLLRDDLDAAVRRGAAVAIGVLRVTDALPGLELSAASDADSSVRFAASEALAHLGDTARLIDALGSGDAEIRRGAAQALGALEAEEAIDPLIAVLGDGTTVVRATAAAALEAVGWTPVGVRRDAIDPRYTRWMTRSEQEDRTGMPPARGGGPTAVRIAQGKLLEADRGSTDPLVRQAALEALGRTRNAALGALAAASLDDPAPGVRGAAAHALELLHAAPTEPPSLARYLVALGRLDDAAALGDDALPALLVALTEPSAERRATAARWLGVLGRPTATAEAAQAEPSPPMAAPETGDELAAEPQTASGEPDRDDSWTDEPGTDEPGADEPAAAPSPAAAPPVESPFAPAIRTALEAALQDDDAMVRTQATVALAARRGADAAPELARRLDDASAVVRTAAARALAAAGDAGRAALLSALTHDDEAARETAALALPLAERGDDAACTALEERLARDPAVAVRVAAAAGLAALRTGDHVGAFRPLAMALERDADAEVRRAAATALGRLEDTAAIPALVQGLGDSYAVVRDAALEALEALGWRAEGGVAAAMVALARGDWKALAAVGVEALPLLAQTLGERGSDAITVERRSRAVGALETIGLAAGSESVQALVLVALSDESSKVRHLAARVAGKLPLPPAADRLLELAETDGFENVRAAAARSLGRCGHSGQQRALNALARGDSSPDVRLAASQALAGPAIGDIAPLLSALTAYEPRVRQGAAEELGELGNSGAVDALLGALGDATAGVRHAARASLVRCGWRPFGVRQSAGARGFDRWVLRSELHPADGATPQLEVLLGALAHADPTIRAAIAEGLGDLRTATPALAADPRIGQAFDTLASDADERVRGAVSAAR